MAPQTTPKVAEKATIIPETEFQLEKADEAKVIAFKVALVALVVAEDNHNDTAINVIEMFEEIRLKMVESKQFLKGEIPMKIYDSMRVVIDADDNLSDKVAGRAKKELLAITRYYIQGMSIRVRDIRFTLFMKLVTLVHEGLLSKTQVKNASIKHQDKDKYVKALEALVTKAEWDKLKSSLDLTKIPVEIQTMVNNITDIDTLKNIGLMAKINEKKLA